MSRSRLLIFAKYPEPGRVMTRLCPPLSADEAATIQRGCIRLLCERAFRAWPVRPLLVTAPDDRGEDFRTFVSPFVPLMNQGEGDLGERLLRAMESVLQADEPYVLIIGSDSPTMPPDRLTQAAEAMGRCDMVIGPAEDGGFYLIGVRRLHPDMFAGVQWGGDSVSDTVKSQATRCGLSVEVLEPWYDIDRFEDLERAARDMLSSQQRDDFELLRDIEEILNLASSRKPSAKARA